MPCLYHLSVRVRVPKSISPLAPDTYLWGLYCSATKRKDMSNEAI